MRAPADGKVVDRKVVGPTLTEAPAAMHARTDGANAMPIGRTVATARVNLLPPEVLLKRRIRIIKRRMAVALALVVISLLGTLGWSKLDASHAVARLETEKSTVTALNLQQGKYGELLRIATVSRSIDHSLALVMKDHVEWDRYLAALAASAPAEIELTGVAVMLQDVGPGGTDVGTASGSLDVSGQEHIGSLTVTGRAPSHEIVATWADSLTEVEGFLVPYILDSSVILDGATTIQFSIEITLSSAIRSGRYVVAPPPATDGQGG